MLLLNRYEVIDTLGKGGMGTVFRALDQTTGQVVALKQMKDDAANPDPLMIERFRREADALRKLNHPNIVAAYDTFEHEGQRYIAMEYIDGGSLQETLNERQRLSIKQTLEIALDLADALTRAHRLQIIHRDLKPANVLLTTDGSPRLTDFGVAHMGKQEGLTQTGLAIGTPEYMAPEVLNGDTVDERADIWSFGVMLYEMLLGSRPFSGNSLGQIVTAILTQPVPDLESLRPDLPVALVDLLYRMLAKELEGRIPSVRLVGAEIEAMLRGIDLMSTSTAYGRFADLIDGVDAPTRNSPFATPTTPVDQVRHNLPAGTIPFIGRQTELHELSALLDDPNVRLLTVLGPGGMGKSRLGIELGRAQLQRHRDGVYVVWMAPLTEPLTAVPAIADAVGFSFQANAVTLRQQLLDYLREKDMLLILDNFEHVLDAADLVNDILQAAPRVKVIATSRARLNLSAENVYGLQGLDSAILHWPTVEAAMQSSAVQLFMQSARRAQPDFALSDADLPALTRICQMVQAMPLGLILAAGWVESLPLAEIADEIAENIDFLESEMRDLPDRHRSLRAVFDYSWNLLNDTERDALVKFSVFCGGFDRDAARKVTGVSLRTLTNLVNKSLLRRDPETGRYYVHTLLQQYTQEFLTESADAGAVHSTHAEYYSELMRKLTTVFNTSKEQNAITTVEHELDNVRAAWEHACQTARFDMLHDMLEPVQMYYLARSMLIEGVKRFEKLADDLESHGMPDETLYWRTRSRQMWLGSRQGDYQKVWQVSSDAYDFFYAAGNNVEMARALTNMSYARMMQGRYDDSKHHAAACFKYADAADDNPGRFTALGNLGYAEYLHGNLEEAHLIYAQIDTLDQDKLSPISRAFALNNTGEILQALGDMDSAMSKFKAAYTIFKSFKHRRGMAFTRNNLAGVQTFKGEYAAARVLYAEAHAIYKDIGDRSGIGHSLSALGNVASFLGETEKAYDYFRQALVIRQALNETRTIADSCNDLGETAFALGRYDEAREHLTQALRIREEIGDQQGLVSSLTWLGILNTLASTGDPEAALQYLDRAEDIAQRLQNGFWMGMVQAIRGEEAQRAGDAETALTHYQAALKVGLTSGIDFITVIAATGIAWLHTIQQPEPTRDALIRALTVTALARQTTSDRLITFNDKISTLWQHLPGMMSEADVQAALARAETIDNATAARELLEAVTA